MKKNQSRCTEKKEEKPNWETPMQRERLDKNAPTQKKKNREPPTRVTRPIWGPF